MTFSTAFAYVFHQLQRPINALLIWISLLCASLMGTLIEHQFGVRAAQHYCYHATWFFLIQALCGVSLLAYLPILYRKRKRYALLLLHLSVVVLWIGAALTHFFSKSGIVHLRENTSTNLLCEQGTGALVQRLPFTIELQRFVLTRYPGSASPASFESHLLLHTDQGTMQRCVTPQSAATYRGYRFFQTSYDADGKGTLLTLTYDPYGTPCTYLALLLLLLTLMATLIQSDSRLRRLLRRLAVPIVCVIGGSLTLPMTAQNIGSPTHLKQVALLPIVHPSGRIVPLATAAEELVAKLQHTSPNPQQPPTAFLLSLALSPDHWKNQPCLYSEQPAIAAQLHLRYPHFAYREAFDAQGHYRYASAVEKAMRRPPHARTNTDRVLLKIDERINLFHHLCTHPLLTPFPTAPMLPTTSPTPRLHSAYQHYLATLRTAIHTQRWTAADIALQQLDSLQQVALPTGSEYSPQKLRAEVFYRTHPMLPTIQKTYLIVGGLLLLLALYSLFRAPLPSYFHPIRHLLYTAALLAAVLHLYDLLLRSYLMAHAPWSNAYGTLVSLSLCVVVSGSLFLRHNRLTTATALIVGGAILWVARLQGIDPQITPLVPVLQSPWLLYHVAALIIGYGFWTLASLLSACHLLLTPFSTRPPLSRALSRLSDSVELYVLLGAIASLVGIVLGAIWANESWGSFWHWDPKETWALATLLLYGGTLHYRWMHPTPSPWLFHSLTHCSWAAVLMTFFGVNYWFSGLHSYGNNQLLQQWPTVLTYLLLLYLLLPPIVALCHRPTPSRHSPL